jgi:hypothetical protein
MAAMRGVPSTPSMAPHSLHALVGSLMASLHQLQSQGGQPSQPASRSQQVPGTLVVLTARPSGPRGIVRLHTMPHLKPSAVPHFTLLMGTLRSSASMGGIFSVKRDNFGTYRALFPEYSWVFLGDSGQADAAVGLAALEAYGGWGGAAPRGSASRSSSSSSSSAGGVGGGIAAVLIHDISPGLPTTGDGGSKEAYGAAGVHFFTSYAGAALGAWRRGVISQEALWRVCGECAEELKGADFSRMGKEAWERALAGTLKELRTALWPGLEGLPEEWGRAETRVDAAEEAEQRARETLVEKAGEASGTQQQNPTEKDIKFAAWSGT